MIAPADAGVDAADLPGFHGPDDVCPGSTHCASAGDGKLYVGVGKAIFTPEITETWTDVDGDDNFDSDEPYVDADGDGTFDGYWLFGSARAAQAVQTDVEARAMSFRQGDTTLVVCWIDAIGMLAGDMDMIREDARLGSLGIDHIVLGSTHAHDAPDTIGISGRTPLDSGIRDDYQAAVRDGAVRAIIDAVNSARAAKMRVSQTLLLNVRGEPASGTDLFNGDIRDPVIYDPTLTVARFLDEGDDTPIGTLINWANHPEMSAFGDDNLKISSHFVHWLRVYTESGIESLGLEGLGGTTVFVQGALGGQIGSLHGRGPRNLDGSPMPLGHEKEQALGLEVAERTLEDLVAEGEDVTGALDLSYRTAEFYARVDNVGFQTLFILDILAPHRLVGYDEDQAVGPGNEPWIPLRATYAQIGPLAFVTAPGELHPELWVGGYDGSWSWGNPILSADVTDNVPDLSTAPDPPYLRDLVLANEGVRWGFIAGCGQDYIGYIVPKYNYVLDETNPYLSEAEGHHYEEVYSLGPDVEEQAVWPILELVKWRP